MAWPLLGLRLALPWPLLGPCYKNRIFVIKTEKFVSNLKKREKSSENYQIMNFIYNTPNNTLTEGNLWKHRQQ